MPQHIHQHVKLSQVDQKWPLVYHLLALVLQSRYRSVEECDTSLTLFQAYFRGSSKLYAISAPFFLSV